MARSMTAFDRRETRADWGRLSWELRSVNHRYLDVHPRLPEELRGLEPEVRERIGQRLARGKVECTLRFEPAVAASGVQVNWDYVDQLLAATRELNVRLHGAASIPATDFLRMPGVVVDTRPDLEPVQAAALSLLDEALEGFVATREREGERLAAMIRDRAEQLASIAATIRDRLPELNQRWREKLEARLAELEQPADPGRLEQELVYVAQRADVAEELDRLEAHVQEIAEVLGRSEPIGRRLDFLMQELNREANTLGSKSAALETTNASVDMKVLIEQMREQIQNLE
ncbi:YicC/YloC family endoribonuclease [Aquisalimonas lutea]|uniref:YicC/YloC family endoribonuclease n=1 Tax=Aquisalimonas lutea TaxID=1327750 RepID=UPI0025B517AC|nr:YicC/YloC family endoribonuclease [Aquisalimonas lutea]MDN3516913.1 YicC/YloC family endoribonuclease [Aquisalimonas lutea]